MPPDTFAPAAIVAPSAREQQTPIDTRAIQALDTAHYLHPFTDFKSLASHGARVMVKGDGIYLWDSEGKRLIDGYLLPHRLDLARMALLLGGLLLTGWAATAMAALTVRATTARSSSRGSGSVSQ